MKIEGFFQFIYQRQAIWYNRHVLGLPKPWSKDEVFNKFRFCNIYRENDRCSIHLIKHVIENKEISFEDKIFNILLFRRFNTPYFFIKYGLQSCHDFKWQELIKIMDENKIKGEKLFNEAYTLCQIAYDKKVRNEKHIQHILMLRDYATVNSCDFPYMGEAGHIEGLVDYFKQTMPLTGAFLSYQYAIDIAYLVGSNEFEDFNSWCDVGPGCLQAIDSMFGKQKNQREYMNRCVDLYCMQGEYLKEDWARIAHNSPYNPKPILSLNNMENALCEYRKYFNLKNGSGRKRYYKGE